MSDLFACEPVWVAARSPLPCSMSPQWQLCPIRWARILSPILQYSSSANSSFDYLWSPFILLHPGLVDLLEMKSAYCQVILLFALSCGKSRPLVPTIKYKNLTKRNASLKCSTRKGLVNVSFLFSIFQKKIFEKTRLWQAIPMNAFQSVRKND